MRKKKGIGSIVKGAPSGLLISLAVHIGAFFLAGALVVISVVVKPEAKFEPPVITKRPKMQLKKPKVKVKKSKPKPSSRIMSAPKEQAMPDIVLPEMGGFGEGFGSGTGFGNIEMPDLEQVSMFGNPESIGNDLVGTFYDFSRLKNGSLSKTDDIGTVQELIRFVASGWNEGRLRKFYKSPQTLYATSVMMPNIKSSTAPTAFGEMDTLGCTWAVLYKGQLTHPEGITFRFWGQGDDVLVVAVDGKVVLNACWPNETKWGMAFIGGKWQSNDSKNRLYYYGNNTAVVGDWITLKPGEVKDLQILIGEIPGGNFTCMLTVQEKGVDYPVNKQHCPILPMFKTSEPSLELRDAIAEHLVKDEIAIYGGPIFRDYAGGGGDEVLKDKDRKRQEKKAAKAKLAEGEQNAEPAGDTVVADAAEESSAEDVVEESPWKPGMRIWTFADGQTLEGEFTNYATGKVMIQDARRKLHKIKFETLSPLDQKYVELFSPPKLELKVSDSASQDFMAVTPYLNEDPPVAIDYTFTGSVKQKGSMKYVHPLTLEYYAIGQQRLDSDKYILLDKKSGPFFLSQEKKSFELSSDKPIRLITYELDSQKRGYRYAEYLAVVKDERGEIIASRSTANWLLEHYENLQKLKIRNFMDKTCTRVAPSGPWTSRY